MTATHVPVVLKCVAVAFCIFAWALLALHALGLIDCLFGTCQGVLSERRSISAIRTPDLSFFERPDSREILFASSRHTRFGNVSGLERSLCSATQPPCSAQTHLACGLSSDGTHAFQRNRWEKALVRCRKRYVLSVTQWCLAYWTVTWMAGCLKWRILIPSSNRRTQGWGGESPSRPISGPLRVH